MATRWYAHHVAMFRLEGRRVLRRAVPGSRLTPIAVQHQNAEVVSREALHRNRAEQIASDGLLRSTTIST